MIFNKQKIHILALMISLIGLQHWEIKTSNLDNIEWHDPSYDVYPRMEFNKEFPALCSMLQKAYEDTLQTPEFPEWQYFRNKHSELSQKIRFAEMRGELPSDEEIRNLDDLYEKLQNTHKAYEATSKYKIYSKMYDRSHNSSIDPFYSYKDKQKLLTIEAVQLRNVARKNWLECASLNSLIATECDELYENFIEAQKKAIAEAL